MRVINNILRKVNGGLLIKSQTNRINPNIPNPQKIHSFIYLHKYMEGSKVNKTFGSFNNLNMPQNFAHASQPSNEGKLTDIKRNLKTSFNEVNLWE